MAALIPQIPRGVRFAEELRLLRADRGVSLKGLAEELGWDASNFGKMESGRTLGSPEVVEALDQFYGTPGLLLALWELAMADPSQFKERYRRYMMLEAEAASLWHYSVTMPPGLLQVPGYVREALVAGGLKGEELEQQVEARIGRQKMLEEEDAPPFRVILFEAVLHNSLCDPREWRTQLEYLVEASERPNITLHVLPFGSGLHGLENTSVMFLRLSDARTVAYAENDVWGELVEETSRVERLHRTFILRMLEEVPCEPST
ncbi:helix-turn-helix transcriptional regulator [Streptomyces sp. NPDC004237]|uniref:helix-turn-helix domain-containing protein n=1 Tax=Streptomyces sp. NPDC004237 TaxID=3154455 RepID=UPI0033B62E59